MLYSISRKKIKIIDKKFNLENYTGPFNWKPIIITISNGHLYLALYQLLK